MFWGWFGQPNLDVSGLAWKSIAAVRRLAPSIDARRKLAGAVRRFCAGSIFKLDTRARVKRDNREVDAVFDSSMISTIAR